MRSLLIIFVLIMGTAFSDCATVEPVQPGEKVAVDYTCRLESGEVVATTLAKIGQSDRYKKSEIFIAPEAFNPIVVETAVKENAPLSRGVRPKSLPLEVEVEQQIRRLIVGLPKGKQRQLEIQSEFLEDMPEGSRYLELATVRKRQKVRWIPVNLYLHKFGHAPEVGDTTVFQQVFNATVTDMNDAYVTVQLEAIEGAVYKTPFGNGQAVDKGSHYIIPLDVKVGHLVRMAGKVGVISKVDAIRFVVDFGHPFGGETLFCDVIATSLDNNDTAKTE